MGLAVAEQWYERSDVDFVFLQVEGVDADYGTPEAGYDAACEDDWEGPGDAC